MQATDKQKEINTKHGQEQSHGNRNYLNPLSGSSFPIELDRGKMLDRVLPTKVRKGMHKSLTNLHNNCNITEKIGQV